MKIDLDNLPQFGKDKTCEYRGIAVQCGPRGLPGESDFLFRNEGGGRFTDVTWDIGERQRLPDDRIELLAATVRGAGARVFRSSVHLHATFDGADKATGVLAFLGTLGVDPATARRLYGFVGDSGNDAAAFAAFETTFAVANVARHLSSFTIPPRYVTRAAMGEGFAELAAALVAGRPVA